MADVKLVAAVKLALADAFDAGICAGGSYGNCGNPECTKEADAQASEAKVWALLGVEPDADDVEAQAAAWTRLHGDAATAQGWGLFQSDRGFEVQRDDEARRFPDDDTARLYVEGRADAGDAGARLALAIAGRAFPAGPEAQAARPVRCACRPGDRCPHGPDGLYRPEAQA